MCSVLSIAEDRARFLLENRAREPLRQGLDNSLIDGAKSVGEGEVKCAERLGGLLKYYHRKTA